MSSPPKGSAGDTSRRIVFFFPYRGTGGVSILFLNLAQNLVKQDTSLNIALIDYPDGYMAVNCREPRVAIWPLEPGVTIDIPCDAVFVMQSAPVWRLPEELKFDPCSKILLWHLHPLNIVPGSFWGKRPQDMFPGVWLCKYLLTGLRRRKLRRLLQLCHEKHGLVFMDGANVDMAQRANGFRLDDPVYLPVPSVSPVLAARRARHDTETLRCAWVGRLEDFKIPVLVYTLKRLASYAEERHQRIAFDVIGTGTEQNVVEDLAIRLAGPHFKVNMLGQMAYNEVGAYLAENIDLHFAMGTAALDGAAAGLPVILLDFSYEPIKRDYKYRYLHQTERYILGSPMDECHFSAGNSSLEDILEQLTDNYAEIAEKTLAYYKSHHTLEFVRESFLEALSETKLSYADLEANNLLANDPLFRAIYALARIDCHIPSN